MDYVAFLGFDLYIDVFSSVVLLWIIIFMFTNKRIAIKRREQRLLFWSFILIFSSFFFKLISHYVGYILFGKLRIFENILVAKNHCAIVNGIPCAILGMVLFYRILFVLGLYLIYLGYMKRDSVLNIALMGYLLVAIAYFSYFAYYIFHITSLVLLLVIISELAKRYSQNKYFKTKLLIISFSLIALSQAIFVAILRNPFYYVIGEIIQLAGFFILFFTFITVFAKWSIKKERA